MRTTIVEAKYGVSPTPIQFGTTDQWDSLDEAVSAMEQKLRDQGDEWTATRLPTVVVLDVHDPPQETIVWIIDTDACEKVWGTPIEGAVKQIVASHGGAVLEPGPEKTLKVSPLRVTPEHIKAWMRTAPLMALTHNAMNDLAGALGGTNEALAFLAEQATEHNKPIAVNVQEGDDSQTVFLSPKGWSEERLKGWVATTKPALEAEFGKVKGPPCGVPSRKQRRKKRRN